MPNKNPKLTFGRHYGEHISEVPSFYLKWLMTKYKGSFKYVEAAREEFSRRTTWGRHWNKPNERRMS